MPDSSVDPLTTLLARREQFIGFLASRLGGNHADAEDLLQKGLVKAIASAPELRSQDRLVPWFYQTLRHAIVDHVRSRQAAATRNDRWTQEATHLAPDPGETEKHVCHCLGPLIDTLPPKQAELVRRVDLNDEPVHSAAQTIGLTPNAASVALHRARTALRAKLQSFCGDCASGACLDCDCPPAAGIRPATD